MYERTYQNHATKFRVAIGRDGAGWFARIYRHDRTHDGRFELLGKEVRHCEQPRKSDVVLDVEIYMRRYSARRAA